MKKIACHLGILTFAFLSCAPVDSVKIKPKTLKYTNLKDSSKNYTATYTYNGDKIVSMISEDRRINFVYEGDNIVKETEYNIIDGKDLKREEKSIFFEAGKEKSITTVTTNVFDNSLEKKEKSVYTYNADGTITKEIYYADSSEGTLKKTKYPVTLTIKNENLIKLEIIDTEKPTQKESLVYEYDNKNNPYKNILGFTTTSRACGNNNFTKTTQVSAKKEFPYIIVTYEYNSDNYPIKATYYASDGSESETIEYTYL